MFKKAKKGFTIVELVIVIAVIGILSAILIPTFANLTQQANDTALKSNLAGAYSAYASDAADGKLDDGTAIVFKGQEEVYLLETSTATEGYQYETEKGWKTGKVTCTGRVLVVTTDAEKAKFNGFYVAYIPTV